MVDAFIGLLNTAFMVVETETPVAPLAGLVEITVGGPVSDWAMATAAWAFTIPLPQMEVVHVLPAGNGVTVLWRMFKTCVGVSDGFTENMSDTTPVTWGAAMLVPW
jgi:hypothetical protein